MNYYSKFDISTVPELTIVKTGVFNPSYELTSGSYSYGKMYFKGWFKRIGYIETANGNWVFQQKRSYYNDLIVSDANGQAIATTKATNIWNRGTTITFADGMAIELRRNGGVFSKIKSWYSEDYGSLLNIESKAWSAKTPFIVSFEPIITKTNINPLLLAFMSASIIITRRQQAATAQ
jgi:hypothetical protein